MKLAIKEKPLTNDDNRRWLTSLKSTKIKYKYHKKKSCRTQNLLILNVIVSDKNTISKQQCHIHLSPCQSLPMYWYCLGHTKCLNLATKHRFYIALLLFFVSYFSNFSVVYNQLFYLITVRCAHDYFQFDLRKKSMIDDASCYVLGSFFITTGGR